MLAGDDDSRSQHVWKAASCEILSAALIAEKASLSRDKKMPLLYLYVVTGMLKGSWSKEQRQVYFSHWVNLPDY